MLAGAKLRKDFDGEPIQLIPPASEVDNVALSSGSKRTGRQEHVNIEMWGIIMSEGIYGSVLYPNHTYKALRIIGENYNLLYTVWCSGERELYDLNVSYPTSPFSTVSHFPRHHNSRDGLPGQRSDNALQNDPYALNNLHLSNHSTTHLTFASSPSPSQTPQDLDARPTSHVPLTTTLYHLLPRLSALLLVLKTCKATQCTRPWSHLHPNTDDDVKNLHDALHERYDAYYERELEKVEFEKCEKGYIWESEGVMWGDSMGRGGKKYAMVDEMAFE